MDSRRFRLSRYLGPRFDSLREPELLSPPDEGAFAEPDEPVIEEPTQVWRGSEPTRTQVAVPRPVLATYDDNAHPDLRLYDAVSSERTDILSPTEAFRQLEESRKSFALREEALREEASRREPFAEQTVPDLGARGSMPSISFEVEQFRRRVSFSPPMFVLLVLLCVGAGAVLSWVYTSRLAHLEVFREVFGG